MAALNWVWAAGGTHNGVAINGVVQFGDDVSFPVISSPSSDGTVTRVGNYPSVRVGLMVRDYATMQTLVAAGMANFVGNYVDDAGANKKRTYKNVSWHSQGRTTVMEPGSSGPTPVWQLEGVVNAAADALSTLIVDAVRT